MYLCIIYVQVYALPDKMGTSIITMTLQVYHHLVCMRMLMYKPLLGMLHQLMGLKKFG